MASLTGALRRWIVQRRVSAAPCHKEAPMFATVRTYSAASELADALVGNSSAVKDLISGIDGFKAYYLVRTADGAVSISIYEDEAGTAESTKAAAAWISENLPGVTGVAPQVSSGEVVINA
jgi:hypothetical protein